ncbi:MAG: hypothetical protein IT560_11600 [Alphaproteobacteria bacterium]|nr:hypothetical protein [Alphaproteobacteria bacterium]
MGVATEENKYLLSPLLIEQDGESRIFITLIDYEHFDYISDVLAERFNIVSTGAIIDDEKRKYVLYFDNHARNELAEAISQINLYHKEHSIIYDTL